MTDEPNTPMEKRRLWLVACSGKQGFESRAVAADVSRRRGKKAEAGSVYKCESCGKYHIGEPAWLKRKGRDR